MGFFPTSPRALRFASIGRLAIPNSKCTRARSRFRDPANWLLPKRERAAWRVLQTLGRKLDLMLTGFGQPTADFLEDEYHSFSRRGIDNFL